jgi:hypothetical protein
MLVAAAGGPTEFGKLVGREQVQVSQWLGGKNVGDRLARDIEEKLGKRTGWLDVLQADPKSDTESQQRRASQPARLDPEMIVRTANALGLVLGRADVKLDLSLPQHARWFAASYQAAEEARSQSEPGIALGAAIAAIIREEPDVGRGDTEAGRSHRARARR